MHSVLRPNYRRARALALERELSLTGVTSEYDL